MLNSLSCGYGDLKALIQLYLKCQHQVRDLAILPAMAQHSRWGLGIVSGLGGFASLRSMPGLVLALAPGAAANTNTGTTLCSVGAFSTW